MPNFGGGSEMPGASRRKGGARVILLKNGTRVPVSRAGAKALSSDLI